MSIIPLFAGSRARRFEAQLRPLLPVLYRYAYRLTGARADAEDLVQDLLLRLYEKELDTSRLDNPQTWLLKVLYRQYIDWQRKSRRTPTLLAEDNASEILAQLPAHDPVPEQHLHQAQLQRQLLQGLAQLNEQQRILILLHDVEGFSLTELQEVLDAPLGTLKSRLHRGRQQLREIFQHDGEPSTHSDRVTG